MMVVSNPYYIGVKVPKQAVNAVKNIVSNGFYKKDEKEQLNDLKTLTDEICKYYNINSPKIKLGDREAYYPDFQIIILTKSSSIISLLHELRHHIQHQAGKRYRGHDIEEDARAWSLRIFKLACPDSFMKSVKAGRIMHIEWDGEKVVNSRGY